MRRVCAACSGHLSRQSDVLCPYCLGSLSTGTRRDLGLAWRTWSNIGSLGSMHAYERALKAAVGEAKMIRAQARLGQSGDATRNANR